MTERIWAPAEVQSIALLGAKRPDHSCALAELNNDSISNNMAIWKLRSPSKTYLLFREQPNIEMVAEQGGPQNAHPSQVSGRHHTKVVSQVVAVKLTDRDIGHGSQITFRSLVTQGRNEAVSIVYGS